MTNTSETQSSESDEAAAEKGHCRECGHNLYRALVEAWPQSRFSIASAKLPDDLDLQMRQVTLELSKLKEFNAGYKEISEFAAWVCGVPIETFCRADMMGYIAERERIAHARSEKDARCEKLVQALERIASEGTTCHCDTEVGFFCGACYKADQAREALSSFRKDGA